MAFINPNLLPTIDATFDVDGFPSWGADAETNINLWSHGTSTDWFLSSPSSLKFTNDAAGPVTISPSRVPVESGKWYVFYVPIRTSSTQTGLTQTLTMTWYDQATDGVTVGTPVTFTAPLTGDPNSAFLFENRFNCFGVPPEGASYVKLSITINGLPARTAVYVDSVYFGEYAMDAGQLLAPSESSFENGADDWTATGATLSRGNYSAGNGNYCLAIEATGTAVALESGTYIPTTPGTNLTGHLYMYSPDGSEQTDLGIRWYDSSHAALSDTVVSVEVTTVAELVYYVFTGTAPANAAYVRVVMSYPATAGETRYIDNVLLAVGTVAADNLLTYEQSTFEAAFPAWTATNGTMAQLALQLGEIDSAHSAQIVSDGTGSIITVHQDAKVPVTGGMSYRFSLKFGRHLTADDVATVSFLPGIDWYDSSQTLIGGTNDAFVQASDSGTLLFYSPFAEATAPDNAAFASIRVQIDPTSSPLIDYWFIDNLSFEETTLQVDATTDDDTGLVRITIQWPDTTDFPRDGYLSVRRIDQDGSANYVRTIWGESSKLRFADTGTPVVLEDYEAPLGTQIWYLAEWFTADDVPTDKYSTAYMQSPVLPSDYVWLKSPGQPAYQARLVPETSFSWSRDARNAEYNIVGRTNPIVWSDVRAGRRATATFLALDTASHIQLDALLGLGTPVLIQAMPGLGADGNHYFAVGDVSPEPVNSNAALAGWRWTLDLIEIDRPSGGIQGSAGSTWQRLLDRGGSWLDLLTGNESWASLLTE